MASLQAVTEAHVRRQKAIAKRVADQLRRLWSRVDPNRIAGSWHSLLPTAFSTVALGQGLAAAEAGPYIEDALEAQGALADAEGLIVAAAFAGIASDGRPLMSLLYEPAVKALVAVKQGQSLVRAKAAGLLSLDTIVRTQISDAGRGAESASIVSRPEIAGYARMLNPPSCARCIILAGRVYKWSQGFKRHPGCDCRHIPVAEDNGSDIRTDPKAYYRSMSGEERRKVFGVAGSKALEDGADMAQVVNARKGIYSAADGKLFTTVGGGARRRIMPEQIYIEAKGNRAEAIRLLKLHGYIR